MSKNEIKIDLASCFILFLDFCRTKCYNMIEEIRFKNVLSYRDEVTLSFEATNETTLEEHHVRIMPNGTRLLRMAMILGANASGKSNLLNVLESLRAFCIRKPKDMDVETGIIPFLLDKETPNQPSQFSLRFWVNNIRYWYKLKITQKRVISEELFFYRTTELIMVFSRNLEGDESKLLINSNAVQIGSEEKKALEINCLPNMSLFAARGSVNMKFEYVDSVRSWFNKGWMPMIEPRTSMTTYSQDVFANRSDFRSYLLDFMGKADFNITDIQDRKENQMIPENILKQILENNELPAEVKDNISTHPMVEKHIMLFEHKVENERGKETYSMSYDRQSMGTKRVVGIEAALYDAMGHDAFLMIDEMETSIHPELMEYILQKYLQSSDNSQILFTTHNDALLRTIDDLLRKDNIWFVEKQKNGSTDLYSLVEFKGLNKISHIEKAYRRGSFGALPIVKE